MFTWFCNILWWYIITNKTQTVDTRSLLSLWDLDSEDENKTQECLRRTNACFWLCLVSVGQDVSLPWSTNMLSHHWLYPANYLSLQQVCGSKCVFSNVYAFWSDSLFFSDYIFDHVNFQQVTAQFKLKERYTSSAFAYCDQVKMSDHKCFGLQCECTSSEVWNRLKWVYQGIENSCSEFLNT